VERPGWKYADCPNPKFKASWAKPPFSLIMRILLVTAKE